MQRLLKKTKELYPDWNPYHGAKSFEGIIELGKITDTLEDMYPGTTLGTEMSGENFGQDYDKSTQG